MTKLIHRVKNHLEYSESDKPIFYLGKELDMIDYSEGSAMCQFVEIKFKDSDIRYLENLNRLNGGDTKWIQK